MKFRIIPLLPVLFILSGILVQGEKCGNKDSDPQFSNKPSDTLIYLERTPCFGFCPTYSYSVYYSGRVEYHGKSHVDSIGYFESKISKQTLVQIIDSINAAGYFSMPATFPTGEVMVADLPSTKTIVRIGEKRHRVLNNNFEPQENVLTFAQFKRLTRLEKFVDDQLKPIKFVRIQP